ncbi:MAG TPA: FG-GAP-like repeat-containing protein [Kofleriaceae bacterium]|nr:FG-GAP-like repeat-containing protein [Kofleriaceae bacterium]
MLPSKLTFARLRGALSVTGLVVTAAMSTAALAAGGPEPGAVTAETVKLPSGPGSVRGLADNASVSAFTGQVQYSVPIDLPTAAGALAPTLSLGYDGGLGNGPLGVGWSISQAGIRRSLRLGVPSYDDTDEIEVIGLAGGQLIAVPDGYRVEGQGNGLTGSAVDGGYELTDDSGTVYRFGTSAGARKASSAEVAVWYLAQVENVAGQTIDYRYHQDLGEVYLDAIEWGPTIAGARAYKAEMIYQARPDSVVSFRTGFRVETAQRLSRVRVWSAGGVRTVLVLTYDQGFALSRLHGVRETSASGADAMPELTFTYAAAQTGQLAAIPGLDGWALNLQGTSLFDVDQDGAMDLLRLTVSGHSFRPNIGGQFGPVQPVPGAASASLDKVRLLDMTGDSAAEMVWQQGSQWRIFQLIPGAGGPSWVAAGSLGGANNVPLASVTIADLDGDYRMDVLQVAGSMMQVRMGGPAGLDAPVVRPAIDPTRSFIQPGNAATRFNDINGDGLVDVVYLASSAMYLYLGRGDGSFEKLHDLPYPWTGTVDASQIHLADLNRDGLLDVAVVRAGNVAWHRGLCGGAFDTAPVSLARPAGTDGSVVVAVADANGNGSEDLVWSSDAGMWILDMAGPTTAGMLTAVENGLGQRQRFAYQASTQLALVAAAAGAAWTSTAPMSMPVATRNALELASGEPTRSNRLDVRDIVYDRDERRFLGFLESTITRPDPADGVPVAQQARQIQRFAPGLGMDRAIRGQVVYERIESGAGVVLRETFRDVAAVAVAGLPDEARLRRAISRSTEVHHLDGLTTPIITRTELEHDGEGRVIVERSLGRLDLGGDESITRRRYTDGVSARGVRDKICEERLLAPDPSAPDGEVLVNHAQTLYGDATSVAPLCDAGAGWVRLTRRYLASETRWVDVESVTYNAAGDPVQRTAAGVTRDLEYDASGLHPVAETVHPSPTRALRWEMTWDNVLGQPTLVREATGAAVAVIYDGLGRIRSMAQSGTNPHVHYRYHHTGPRPYSETFTYNGPATAVPALPATWSATGQWQHVVIVADSAGEQMFRAVRLAASRWLVTDRQVRDAIGRPVAVAEPFEWQGTLDGLVASALPAGTPTRTATYDALDRVIAQGLPTGEHATHAYRPFELTDTADGLSPVVSVLDGEGRVLRTSRTVNGAAESVEATYDAAGLLTSMRLPTAGGAVEHRYEYDSLGRLVFATDPDIGDRLFDYEDSGRLIQQTNGAGQTIAFAYDGAGRLTTMTDSDGQAIVYHYDDALDPTAFPYTAGRLAWIEEPTGRVQIGYDRDGEEARFRRTVGGRTAERSTTRAASGLALAVDDGDGFSFDLAYDPAGRLTRVGDFWQVEEQDAAGRSLRERFGNGVVQTWQRDALGRSRRLRVLAPAGDALYSVQVGLHATGAIASVADQDGVGLDHSAAFTYDGGGRLTSARIGASPTPYQFAYQYDGLQNMIRREAHGPTALGIVTGAYHHGEPDAGGNPTGPRQLTSIVPDAAAGSPPGATAMTFDYDAAGRMVREGTTELEYDGFDRLIRVSGLPIGSGQVTHDYGYDGLRVRTVEPDGLGTTWFTQDVSETDDGVRRIDVKLGDRLIARVTRDPVAEGAAGAATAARGVRAAHVLGAALVVAGFLLLLAALLVPRGRRGRLRPAIGAATLLALALASCQGTTGLGTIASHTTSQTLYYHAAIGAGPSLITREDGTVFDERRYEPFGATIDSYRTLPGGGSEVGPVDLTRDPHDIHNKERDPATGWSYQGARWMAPEIAAWTVPDPPVKAPDPVFMTAPWALHPYQFVQQNPVFYWDPDGQQPAPQDYMPDSVKGYKDAAEANYTAKGIITRTVRAAADIAPDVVDGATPFAEALPIVGTYLLFKRGEYFWGTISAIVDVASLIPLVAEARIAVVGGRTTVTLARTTIAVERVAVTTERVAVAAARPAVAAAKVTAAAAKPIGWTGKIGEAILKKLGGQSQVFFRTSRGGRYIDQLVNGVAHESKVGRMALTKKIEAQVLKDAELVSTGQVKEAVWHFFTSPQTGLVGPTGPLEKLLNEKGIKILINQ